MTNFSFRLRFNLSSQKSIAIEKNEIELSYSMDKKRVLLISGETDKTIDKANQLVLKGSNFDTEEEAKITGKHYQDILMLTLARLRIGSDFGNRKGKGEFVPSYLEKIRENTGERILNNEHGLMIYETNPPPTFVLWNINGKVCCTQEKFETIFKFIEQKSYQLSERERISLEMFNASFFIQSVESKLITLVSAIELLIEPENRNDEAQKHIGNLIEITKQNEHLSTSV